MFTVDTIGPSRLVSDHKLTVDDFREIARRIGTPPVAARKTGLVAAHAATTRHDVETVWNGKETKATAEIGDLLVTSLDGDGVAMRDAGGAVNTYVVKQDQFGRLYAPTDRVSAFEKIYTAKGHVEAIYLPGGFEIVAPWGEVQRGDVGYLLLNGREVYGNHRDVFERTYALDR